MIPRIIIDNLALLREFLQWPADNNEPRPNGSEFYEIQVLKRKKDQPNPQDLDAPAATANRVAFTGTHHSNASVLQTFQVYSEDQLIAVYPRIKQICCEESARAYIAVNRSSTAKVCDALAVMAIEHREVPHLKFKQMLSSAISRGCCEPHKWWVIDADNAALATHNETILELQDRVLAASTFSPPTTFIVPTPHGFHILTHGFDARTITGYDIHKDNPTVLYADVYDI